MTQPLSLLKTILVSVCVSVTVCGCGDMFSTSFTSSEAVVEFDQTFYTVVEGQSLSVTMSVRSGVTLERDVVVTLMTVDDSATGNV